MFAAMLHLKNASADDFKDIYALISGGEPLPAAVAQAFQQRFNTQLYEGYGLTETGPVLSLNRPQANKLGSVGQPVPGVECRLVDDSGKDVPAGESGELWCAGRPRSARCRFTARGRRSPIRSASRRGGARRSFRWTGGWYGRPHGHGQGRRRKVEQGRSAGADGELLSTAWTPTATVSWNGVNWRRRETVEEAGPGVPAAGRAI